MPLVQELFVSIDEEIHSIKGALTAEVARTLNLEGEKALGHLENRLQPLFQEYSLAVFQFSDEKVERFLLDKYVPRCLEIVKERDGAEDEFLDNVKTSDFKRFFRAALKLSLHMVLNDPPILMSLAPWSIRRTKSL